MSQPVTQPVTHSGWTWDPRTRRWWYYDPTSQDYVFDDGSRVRRDRPRNLPSPATPVVNPTTVKTAGHPNYVTAPGSKSQQQYAQAEKAHPSAHADPASLLTRGVSAMKLDGRRQQQATEQKDQHGAQGSDPSRDAPRVTTLREPSGVIQALDRISGVAIRVQREPAQEITEENLLRDGVFAQARLLPTDGDTEQLFHNFQRRPQPRNYFILGRVFFTLWAEPAGDTSTLATGLESGTHPGILGEKVHSKVRRFVVIREGINYSSCLPIVTHRRQGVAKPGTRKSDFSIIYTSKYAPAPRYNEQPKPGEHGMRSEAIRVTPDLSDDQLDAMSRLDYGKVHTVHHNVKVRNLGLVHPHSRDALSRQFDEVWRIQSQGIDTSRSDQTPRQQSGLSQGNTASNDPATVRQYQSRDQRDSQSGMSKTSGESQTGRGKQQQLRQVQPSFAPKSVGSAGESSGRSEASSDDLQRHAQAAVANLVKRGFSREQAVAAVRKRLQEQQNSIIEEEAAETESESESEDEGSTEPSRASDNRQERDRRPSQGAKSSGQQSQGRSQGQGLGQQGQYTKRAQAQHPPRSSSREQSSAQPHPRSSGTKHPGTAAAADTRTPQERMEAEIRSLVAAGYSRTDALRIVRDRMARGTQR